MRSRYKLWGLANVLCTIALGIWLFWLYSSKPLVSSPARRPSARDVTARTVALPSAKTSVSPTIGPKRISDEAWSMALNNAADEWADKLRAEDPTVVGIDDVLKATTMRKYRYIFESLSDQSPPNRARMAVLLYQVELAEHHVDAAANKLGIRDTAEIDRLKEANATAAVNQAVMSAGTDGARLAELLQLRHAMGDFEVLVRPTLDFNQAGLSAPQQIEVVRVLERYDFRHLHSPELIQARRMLILNDCAQILSEQQLRVIAEIVHEKLLRTQPGR